MIAPPTSCPRFRATIHNARYFPRAPEGASVIIAPASATYQQPVPTPAIAPLRIRYYSWLSDVLRIRGNLGCLLRRASTHPLVSKLAIAVICGPLDRPGHRSNNQSPLNTQLVHDGSAQEASWKAHHISILKDSNRATGYILIASRAYLRALEIFDTSGVARPPPPRPRSTISRMFNHFSLECPTSNCIRDGRSTERLNTQKEHLRQTVLPYPLPQRDIHSVLLQIDSVGRSGLIGWYGRKSILAMFGNGIFRDGHRGNVSRGRTMHTGEGRKRTGNVLHGIIDLYIRGIRFRGIQLTSSCREDAQWRDNGRYIYRLDLPSS